MVHKVLIWPNPTLRKKSEDIEPGEFDGPAISNLITDMIDTMDYHQGVGLAAVQIGVLKRVFVLREANGPQVYINPVVTFRSPEKELMREGCLSLPGIVENVLRHVRFGVRAQDLMGRIFEAEHQGLLAQATQHELDHLNGKMYPDKKDPGYRDRLRNILRSRS